MKERGILVSYLLSPLSKITNSENNSQFKLVKGSNSNRVNDLLIHNTIPVTLYNNRENISINTQINVFIHKYKHLNNCMYTQI